MKRPAGKATGPPGKFRRANDGEKQAPKKPFVRRTTDGDKTDAKKPFVKKSAGGQKPFVKKGGAGQKPFVKKPFVKKDAKPGEKAEDEKPKWFEMKKKDRKKVSSEFRAESLCMTSRVVVQNSNDISAALSSDETTAGQQVLPASAQREKSMGETETL